MFPYWTVLFLLSALQRDWSRISEVSCSSGLFLAVKSCFGLSQFVRPRGRASVSVTWPSEACQEPGQDVLTHLHLTQPRKDTGVHKGHWQGLIGPALSRVGPLEGRQGCASGEAGQVPIIMEVFDFFSWTTATQVFFLPSLCLKGFLSEFLKKGPEDSLTPYSCH